MVGLPWLYWWCWGTWVYWWLITLISPLVYSSLLLLFGFYELKIENVFDLNLKLYLMILVWKQASLLGSIGFHVFLGLIPKSKDHRFIDILLFDRCLYLSLFLKPLHLVKFYSSFNIEGCWILKVFLVGLKVNWIKTPCIVAMKKGA